jgi:VanZ family protein
LAHVEKLHEQKTTLRPAASWQSTAVLVFLYVLPALVWMTTLIVMGSDTGSGSNSRRLLEGTLDTLGLLGFLSDRVVSGLHVGLRKLGHFTAYALLGILFARLARRVWTRLSTATAVACWFASVGQAAADELHQSHFASRTASVLDVGIDALGAAAGITLYRIWRERCRKSE